jgi:signal transduction histidine kinase
LQQICSKPSVVLDIPSVLNSRIFRTVSFQLAALYGLIFATCFMGLLLTTYWTTTSALRGQMQTEIRTQLNTMTTEATADGIETIVQDINERTAQGTAVADFYFLSDPAGKKLAGNLDGIAPVDGWHETGISDAAIAKLENGADEDHQVWAQGTHLPDGSFLLVGQDAFRLLAAQEAIINTFGWLAGIAFLLATLAGLLVSRGFLRRIDDINTTSLAIIDGRLKERIPVRGTSDEVDRLSANLNQLFDSNQSLLESLKQVSANIAHDLRTPLSRLRQGLEEARTKSGSVKSYKAVIDGAIAESDVLLSTFSALLRIAQIESGSRKAGFKDADLGRIFERVADAYQAVAEDQGKRLKTSLIPHIKFHGDSELLLQMIANLTENAIRHTPAGANIMLSLEATPSGSIAVVSDSGTGIPAVQREKVFEHFYRMEESRTTPGNGLGLALVAAIAKLHRIHISLQDNGPGLKVVLTFPASEMA